MPKTSSSRIIVFTLILIALAAIAVNANWGSGLWFSPLLAGNDPPVISNVGGTLAYTEGDPATVIDASLTVTDPDDANMESATVTITLGFDVSEDVLACIHADCTAGGLITVGGTAGALTLTGSATKAEYEAALERVTYMNLDGFDPSTASRTVEWVVNDGTANSTGVTSTITVIAVNDAPLLDSSKNPVLNAQNENDPLPSGAVGTLVSSLVDFASPPGQVDNVTDADSGALLGIAVIGANTTSGTWYYSINSGATWDPLGTPSSSSARLLAASPGNRLYFQPNIGFNGTIANAITFRAWDRTSGTDGSVASTTLNGGTTAFSAATDTASLTIIAAATPTSTATSTPTATNTATSTPTPLGCGGTFSYTGPDVAIPDNLPAGVDITIPVSGVGNPIADVNFSFDGTQDPNPASPLPGINHSWVGDIVVKVTSPLGTSVVIYDRPGYAVSPFGCSNNNLAQLLLDDDGGFLPVEDQCNPIGPVGDSNLPFPTGSFAPNNPMSAFDGESADGNWVINISDNAGSDIGSARAFSLIIDSSCPTATNTATATDTATATATATPAGTPVLFPAGSLFIPMDTSADGQNNGMLRAYGLVYQLLRKNIPVYWAIDPVKAAGGDDFVISSGSLQDVRTAASITVPRSYRGGPFAILASDAAAALPIIATWQASPGDSTAVHRILTGSVSPNVARSLVRAPRIAILKDGNETIAFNNLNAAGITDAVGASWTAASPDLLTEAAAAGPTTTDHTDGVLFHTSGGLARYGYFASMHYNITASTAEVVQEARSWLTANSFTHAFMQCEAARVFENDSGGLFLTTAGLVDDGAAPALSTVRVPSDPLAQIDGSFQADSGSVDSIGKSGGFFRTGVMTLINDSASPLLQRIVLLTGNIDGNASLGKVTYLAGHDYSLALPISTNPQTNGVRLFLNSIFESGTATDLGQADVAITKLAPAITNGSTIAYTINYSNPGPRPVENLKLIDTLPVGATYLAGSGSPAPTTNAGGVLTWNLPSLASGAGGSVTFSVSVTSDGTYNNSARLQFSHIAVREISSNTVATVRDTVPPTVTIPGPPTNPVVTNDLTPTFIFSVTGGAVSTQCRIDSGSFAPCVSPFTAGTPLLDGPHSLEIVAVDAAGNVGADSLVFEVDTIAPIVTIPVPPNVTLTNDSTPSFTFADIGVPGTAVTFECRIDSDPFVPCTSPFTSSALADGNHTFSVKATDAASNVGLASLGFFVNTSVISGTVTYGNAIGNPVPPRFVKNVSLSSTVGSPAVGPVITGTPGTYTLTGFGVGSYTIKPTKPGGSNGAITSNDAARVAQGVTGSLPFVSNNQRFAADVTGNGGVSSGDAAKIAQYVAGLPFSPPNFAGEWRFFISDLPAFPAGAHPQERTYASVTSSVAGEDYVGVLIGEVSGNWNPASHPRPVGSKLSAVSSGPERGIDVGLPQMTASTGKEIVIPVSVQGAAEKGIISYEFVLRYDPTVLQPLADSVDVARTVSRGLSVVTNAAEPGLLRVVVYGAMPIDENGVLVNLRFTAVGTAGSSSPLTWERFMLNEGLPMAATSGQIELF